MKQTRNTLNDRDKFKVFKFIEFNKYNFRVKTCKEIMNTLNKEFNQTFTTHTVREWLKTLEITYKRKTKKPKKKDSFVKYKTQNNLKIHSICLAIKELFDDSGAKVPAGILEILEGKR